MKKLIDIKKFMQIFLGKMVNSNLIDGGMVIAYSMLFSLFPLIIITLNIISLTFKGRESDVIKILDLFPDAVAKVVGPIVFELIYSSSAGFLSVSILITLWFGSIVTQKLMNEISHAFMFKRKIGYVKEKLLAVVLALILILAFFILLITGPLSSLFFKTVEAVLGKTLVIDYLFHISLFLSPYILMLIILTVIYKVSVLGSGISVKQLLPASLFTSVGMFVLTAGYTYYMDNIVAYSKIYGSLGGVIILLLWLFLSGIVMILGGHFASSLMEYRKKRTPARGSKY